VWKYLYRSWFDPSMRAPPAATWRQRPTESYPFTSDCTFRSINVNVVDLRLSSLLLTGEYPQIPVSLTVVVVDFRTTPVGPVAVESFSVVQPF